MVRNYRTFIEADVASDGKFPLSMAADVIHKSVDIRRYASRAYLCCALNVSSLIFFIYYMFVNYCYAIIYFLSGLGPKQVTPAWCFLRLPDVKPPCLNLPWLNFLVGVFFV